MILKNKVLNVSLLDYINFADEKTSFNLKYGKFKAVDHLKLGDYNAYTFGFVKILQHKLSSGRFNLTDFIKIVAKEYNKKEKELFRTSVYELKESFMYLVEQIEAASKIEKELLTSEPDGDMVSAGINSLAKFGVFVQIDKLAGGDPLKYSAVEKLKYSTALNKLHYDTEVDHFKRKHAQRISKKK